MNCFTDIENKPDDWLVLDPLTIQKPIPKTGCDTNLIVLNYLSEFKTEALKLKVKDNLGLYVDNILSNKSLNPIANKTVFLELNKIRGHVGLNQVEWNMESNMNDFIVAGVYDIKGEHKRVDDNLPILNIGSGHSFNASLTVLDSSISGSGKDDDKCITQILSFNNRLGQGEVYIRTGKGSSLNNLIWEKWSTLLRNVNVDKIDSLDDLKDNGIYSGVWSKGHYNSYPLTFVCVVINDYFIGTAPRRISQFVYGLSKFDGSVICQSRVWDDSKDKWSNWEILNKNEISSMISAEIKKVTDGIDPSEIDSIKDIIAWIEEHGGDVTAIYNAIKQNTDNIDAEMNRSKGEEQNIKDKAVEANSLNFQARANEVAFDYKTIGGEGDEITIPAATAEKAGVMSAVDKVLISTKIGYTFISNGEYIKVPTIKAGETIYVSPQGDYIIELYGKTEIEDKEYISIYGGSKTADRDINYIKCPIANREYYIQTFQSFQPQIDYIKERMFVMGFLASTPEISLTEKSVKIPSGTYILGASKQVLTTDDIIASPSDSYGTHYVLVDLDNLQIRFVQGTATPIIYNDAEVLVGLVRWSTGVVWFNSVNYIENGELIDAKAVKDVPQINNFITRINNTAAKVDGNTFSSTANEVKLTTTGTNISNQHTVILPAATTEKAGVMSAEDKVALNKATTDIQANTDLINTEKDRALIAESSLNDEIIHLNQSKKTDGDVFSQENNTDYIAYSVEKFSKIQVEFVEAANGANVAVYFYDKDNKQAGYTLVNNSIPKADCVVYNNVTKIRLSDSVGGKWKTVRIKHSQDYALGGENRILNTQCVDLKKENLKILDIGNSYTEDSHTYLASILNAVGAEDNFSLYKAVRGSGTFDTWLKCYNNNDGAVYNISHTAGKVIDGIAASGQANDGSAFRNALTAVDWNIIIIHQVSNYSPYYYAMTANAYYGKLYEFVRLIKETNPQAAIGWLLVHSYAESNSQNTEGWTSEERWRRIADATKGITKLGIDFVIPYGTAVQNLRASSLNNGSDFSTDGTHLATGLGDYVASCCYYQTLFAPRFGVSITGNTFRANVDESVAGRMSITDETAAIAQKAAMLASYDWYNINKPD